MTSIIQIAQLGSLDDLLFRGKNKAYGAYQLRKEYEHRLRRAFLLFFTALTSLVIIVPAYQKFMGNYIHVDGSVIDDGHIYNPTTPMDIDTEKSKVEQTLELHDVKLDQFVEPEIVESVPEQDSKIIDEIIKNDGLIAANNNDGPVSTIPNSRPLAEGNPSEGSALADPDPNTIYDIVTDEPQFLGDLQDYLGRKAAFPEFEKDMGITKGQVVVGFVVNEDGSLSNIHLELPDRENFNIQALRAIQSMPKWKPGSNYGHKVKVNISIPFNFVLD